MEKLFMRHQHWDHYSLLIVTKNKQTNKFIPLVLTCSELRPVAIFDLWNFLMNQRIQFIKLCLFFFFCKSEIWFWSSTVWLQSQYLATPWNKSLFGNNTFWSVPHTKITWLTWNISSVDYFLVLLHLFEVLIHLHYTENISHLLCSMEEWQSGLEWHECE